MIFPEPKRCASIAQTHNPATDIEHQLKESSPVTYQALDVAVRLGRMVVDHHLENTRSGFMQRSPGLELSLPTTLGASVHPASTSGATTRILRCDIIPLVAKPTVSVR